MELQNGSNPLHFFSSRGLKPGAFLSLFPCFIFHSVRDGFSLPLQMERNYGLWIRRETRGD